MSRVMPLNRCIYIIYVIMLMYIRIYLNTYIYIYLNCYMENMDYNILHCGNTFTMSVTLWDDPSNDAPGQS